MQQRLVAVFCVMLSFSAFSQTDQHEVFYNDMFSSFSEALIMFAEDYSVISSLYNAGGSLQGSASIGSFPSFRVGTTFNVIFFTNPVNFLKEVQIGEYGYDKIVANGTAVIDWFDDNFLPLPYTSYYIEAGLPLGLTASIKFNASDLGGVVNGIVDSIPSANSIKTFVPDLFLWGIGGDIGYTILKDFSFFPTLAVSTGGFYSSVSFALKDVNIGNVEFGGISGDSINTTMSFTSKSDISSLFFDFAISKRLLFFEPFANMKFVQTFYHNYSEITFNLDLSDASDAFKEVFNEEITISNEFQKDNNGNPMGIIYPVTDFLLSAGFELILYYVRFGFEATYSPISQNAMLSLGLHIHFDKDDFQSIKSFFEGRNK